MRPNKQYNPAGVNSDGVSSGFLRAILNHCPAATRTELSFGTVIHSDHYPSRNGMSWVNKQPSGVNFFPVVQQEYVRARGLNNAITSPEHFPIKFD